MDFPEKGLTYDDVLRHVSGFSAKDHRFETGRVFNSICSKPLPIAVEAYRMMMDANLGDNRIFPGVQELEHTTTKLLGNLLGADRAAGNLVSGGTEANLIAMLAARIRGAQRGIREPEIVAPLSVHYSVEKIARILNMKLTYAKLDDRYCADVNDIEAKISDKTIAIIATAGTSELGAIDDIPAIATIALKHGLYFHVDAATGGFIIPFAKRLRYAYGDFDFSVEGVDSITVDPHKFGLAVIPSGYILFREQKTLDSVRIESHYLGTKTHTTLLGTRPGAAVASVYAVLTFLGWSGYCSIVEMCLARTRLLAAELTRVGWELLTEPMLTIVTVKCTSAQSIMSAFEERGWILSVSRRYRAIRIVVHHHTTVKYIRELIDEFSRIGRLEAAAC